MVGVGSMPLVERSTFSFNTTTVSFDISSTSVDLELLYVEFNLYVRDLYSPLTSKLLAISLCVCVCELRFTLMLVYNTP